jgi:hypothetical protein
MATLTEWVSVKEAAERSGIAKSRIWALAAQKKLISRKTPNVGVEVDFSAVQKLPTRPDRWGEKRKKPIAAKTAHAPTNGNHRSFTAEAARRELDAVAPQIEKQAAAVAYRASIQVQEHDRHARRVTSYVEWLLAGRKEGFISDAKFILMIDEKVGLDDDDEGTRRED